MGSIESVSLNTFAPVQECHYHEGDGDANGDDDDGKAGIGDEIVQ